MSDEKKNLCPVCGQEIDIGEVDVNNNEEDGYGEMICPHTCPHCNAALTAHFDAGDAYAFLYFEED